MSLTAIAMLAAAAPVALPPGFYANEEEVYFAKEAGKAPPPWIAIYAGGKAWRTIDAFGALAKPPVGMTVTHTAEGVTVTLPGGITTKLRRARPATCWGAVLKKTRKPDGGEDWHGARQLMLHDQGGRVRLGGGATGAPEATLKMRNVVWPSGPNRPSLVLYVLTPEGGERAVSYSWADKDAKTVGINLRWMQASCTIDEPQGETVK